MSTPEQPSVDWLDPARESCLIDGVRYRKYATMKDATLQLAWAPDEMGFVTRDGEVVRYRLVPTNQHPKGGETK